MLKDDEGPVDPVGVSWSGTRAGGNDGFTRGGFFPLGLLEKGNEVANLVESSFMEKKRTERPLLSRANTESSLAKDLSVLVLAFPHLKPTVTSWSEIMFDGRQRLSSNHPPPPGQGEMGMSKFALNGDASSPQLYCWATRTRGAARKAPAPVPWMMRMAFGARTPMAEFMPPLRETALEPRFLSPNSDYDREERRWKHAFWPSKHITWLEATPLEVLVPNAGTNCQHTT